MRFLIAGLGSIGRRHLRNLVALGEKDIVLYRTYQGSLPMMNWLDFQWRPGWMQPWLNDQRQ